MTEHTILTLMRDLTAQFDYSAEVDPRDPTARPNLPTPGGREIGAQVASETERLVERFPQVPLRCSSCVFRYGTDPNGCIPTLGDALKCAVEGEEPFLCAHVPGEEGAVCAGYLLWRKWAFEIVKHPITDEEERWLRGLVEAGR